MMLNGEYDVASAAYAVGYESPTQFSREYKRMFGIAAQRHAQETEGTVLRAQGRTQSLAK